MNIVESYYYLYGGSLAQQYENDVLATSPIAFWNLNEGSGTNILDSSGNSYDGTYTGVTWDGTQSRVKEPVPFWDGTNDYGDIHSAGFASAIDLDEFCVLLWVKVQSASVWSDGTFRRLFEFFVSTNDRIIGFKASTSNTLTFRRSGNGTAIGIDLTTSTTDWFSVMVSASINDDEFKVYLNGVQQGSTINSLTPVTSSSIGTGLLGALNINPLQVWHGYLANAAVWDKPADADMIALGVPS